MSGRFPGRGDDLFLRMSKHEPGRREASPLKKKGKVARSCFPDSDRFRKGRDEGGSFRHPPPFFPPEGFPDGEYPELFPWKEWKQRGPVKDIFFRDPWVREFPPSDDWMAYPPWNEEIVRESESGHDPGVEKKKLFSPRDPLQKKRRSERPLESVEKLSPSLDETEWLYKIRLSSRFRKSGKREVKD